VRSVINHQGNIEQYYAGLSGLQIVRALLVTCVKFIKTAEIQ
jgi:hypothetical protein